MKLGNTQHGLMCNILSYKTERTCPAFIYKILNMNATKYNTFFLMHIISSIFWLYCSDIFLIQKQQKWVDYVLSVSPISRATLWFVCRDEDFVNNIVIVILSLIYWVPVHVCDRDEYIKQIVWSLRDIL